MSQFTYAHLVYQLIIARSLRLSSSYIWESQESTLLLTNIYEICLKEPWQTLNLPYKLVGEVDRGWGLRSPSRTHKTNLKFTYHDRNLLPTLPDFKK